MAYERQVFVDQEVDENGDVVVSGTTLKKAHLDHIEDGIVANETAVAKAATAAELATTAAAEAKETANAAATAAAQKELPTVTTNDDGKILQVVNGTWAAVAITDGNTVAY